MWGLLTFFGRDLLGCLARFDLLDGVYLLGFAGRGSLGQVCSFRFALSGWVRFARSVFLSQLCLMRFAGLGLPGFGILEGGRCKVGFPRGCLLGFTKLVG